MTNLNPNFLCECGHRNKMHVIQEPNTGYNSGSDGKRICVEFENWPYNHVEDERICMCSEFTPDNLKTLEMMQKPTIEINPFLRG